MDRSAWSGLASRAESHTFGALVLKQPRNRPHRDPVPGRMWCSALTGLGDLDCSLAPSKRTHKGIHMFVRVTSQAFLAILSGFSAVFNREWQVKHSFWNEGFVSVLPAEPLTWASTVLSGHSVWPRLPFYKVTLTLRRSGLGWLSGFLCITQAILCYLFLANSSKSVDSPVGLMY